MAHNISFDLDVFDIALKDLALGSPLCVDPNISLKEAANLMQDKHIGSLLVVEDEKLVGILTERDFLMKVTAIVEDLENTVVEQVMTYHPFTLNGNDGIKLAMLEMNKNQFRHVPVVDENEKPLFVVSIKDLMDFILDKLPKNLEIGEMDDLPDHDDL